MSAALKDKAVTGLKKTWCNTWTFSVNLARRSTILARYTLACWQQYRLKKALGRLGAKTFEALEKGEANPLAAPAVNEALQKAIKLKERKERNYLAIEAIRERIATSCVIPTPEEPGGVEETPPVP